MKLLIIGKFYTEGFALHIAETLAAMGHQVSRFEPGFKAGRVTGRLGHRLDQLRGVIYTSTDGIPQIRSKRIQKLWDVVAEHTPQSVIVCHDFLWPDEVAQLKNAVRGPVAMWFPDHLANFGRAFFMNAPYDALFFKDPFIVVALGDVLRSPVYYLPECFNPARHRLVKDFASSHEEFECDIATAGNQHSWRVAYFSHLTENRIRIWGAPAPLWMPAGPIQAMHQGRGVYNEEKARAFTAAKIVLNNLHYGEVWGVNVRCFEAAGVGAFQIVDWRPGLYQLFEDGRELVAVRSVRDLREKIAYWLPRDDERKEIALAGKKRAYEQHTYSLRLQLLLDTLNGRERGFALPHIRTLAAGAAI